MVRAGCAACGGFSTPEEIMELVCSHLRVDGSLACDSEQQLYVEIEPLADNCTVRGPSGGIYTPCNSSPPGIRCRRTIDGLPDFITIGNTGGSGLTHAYASPQAIEYAIDNRVDMISNISWSLVGDLVSAWGPYYGETSTAFYTTDQADATGWTVYASEWSQLLSDAGTTESPTGRNSDAPEAQKTPDGGWYGFHAPQYRLLTVPQVLHQVDGRAVVRIQCADGNPYGGVARDVTAAMRAVNIMCAQDYAMIMVGATDLAQVPVIEGDNIRSMVFTNMSLTPAEIVDSGTQWVQTGHEATDEFITSLVDSGLNVILDTNARHVQTQRAMDLGCRGVASSDPVYHRGPVNPPETYGYRRTTNNYIRGFTSLGHLTAETDAGGGIAARGYHRADAAGLYVHVDSTERIDILQGNLSPISQTDAYTLTASFQVDADSLPAYGGSGLGPRMGLIFGAETDLNPGDDETTRTGYWAVITMSDSDNGRLIIGRYEPGTGESTQLAETAGSAVTPNEWINLTVTVAGGTVTVTRSDGENYSVSITDSQWRGEYFFAHANNSTASDGDWYGGFADISAPDLGPIIAGEGTDSGADGVRDDGQPNGDVWIPAEPATNFGTVTRSRS